MRATHFSSRHSIGRQRRVKALVILLVMSLIAASCGGASDDDGSPESSADVGIAPLPGEVPAGDDAPAEGVQTVDLAAVPTAPPSMFATPTPENTGPVDPWEVNVLTAKDDTGFVPTFEQPGGESFTLFYEYLDGSTIEYPLVNPTFFGNPLALLVLEGQPGDTWAKVSLPIRPNNSVAWVQTAFFEWSSHSYHVDIDVGTNFVRVWNGDELVIESEAVTGREDRPTPVLRTYIDEKLPGPNEAYGDWVLSLASFSNSISTFSGGLPKLALHGTNQPELIGQYASSGCIRVPNEIIRVIAEQVPVGATVDIFNSRG